MALALLVAVTGLGLVGCATAEFYTQAALGQASLLLARRDAQAVIDDPQTDPAVAEKLRLVAALLRYAEGELALPAGNRYQSYVEVEGPVVWIVAAAPEFSVSAVPRCYPIIGCAVYRGYFSQHDAKREAARLAREHDIVVTGSAAYSTLGWFDDPVLSSFLGYDDGPLANLIFHELAHSVIYIRDDSAFNESFASFVGVEGAARWLADNGGDADAYRARVRAAQDYARYLAAWREVLANLYRQPILETAKRQLKAEAFRAMRRCYQANRDRFGRDRENDMAAANNAFIALAATYQEFTPAFAQLFRERNGDWIAFYEAVRELGDMPPEQRAATLKRLAAEAPQSVHSDVRC